MEKNDNKDFSILNVDYVKYKTLLNKKFLNRKKYSDPEADKLFAFISGKIKDVLVKKGSRISEGDPLLILEAMKMYNHIVSPVNGKIKKIHVKDEDRVSKNQLLIEFTID